MIPALNAAAIFLIGYIGLHLPRSFLLFYIFAGAVLARARFLAYEKTATAFRYQLRTAVLLLIFAITYAVGMVLWGFWTWPTDSLDIINSLVLPALLFFVGDSGGSVEPCLVYRRPFSLFLWGLGLRVGRIGKVPRALVECLPNISFDDRSGLAKPG